MGGGLRSAVGGGLLGVIGGGGGWFPRAGCSERGGFPGDGGGAGDRGNFLSPVLDISDKVSRMAKACLVKSGESNRVMG